MICCIPNKMLITKKKILASDIGHIIKKHEKIFEEELYSSNEFNSFAAFLIREKIKGDTSFFAPYIDVMQKTCTLLEWDDNSLREVDDKQLIDEVRAPVPG